MANPKKPAGSGKKSAAAANKPKAGAKGPRPSASQTSEAEPEFPVCFVTRVVRESGPHYIFSRAILSVREDSIPASAREAMTAAFADAATGQGTMSLTIPLPGEAGNEYKKWMLLQMSMQFSEPD